MSVLEKFSYSCFILAAIIIVFTTAEKLDNIGKPEILKKVAQLKKNKTVIIIPNNPTSEYNYLKKTEIFKLRRMYVQNSIFNLEKYIPTDEVFGHIEDNKPWYGLKYYNCAANAAGTEDVTLGDSEESRFINNPVNLVGINCGGYSIADYKNDPVCTDKIFLNIPHITRYIPETNTIEASYTIKNGHSCTLTGLNARDLGFDYVYAKNYKNLRFKNEENISNKIYKFRDYLHTGGSCGLAGGCTNGSPRQTALEFIYEEKAPKAVIDMQLWHKKPEFPFIKEDINYKIIISSK